MRRSCCEPFGGRLGVSCESLSAGNKWREGRRGAVISIHVSDKVFCLAFSPGTVTHMISPCSWPPRTTSTPANYDRSSSPSRTRSAIGMNKIIVSIRPNDHIIQSLSLTISSSCSSMNTCRSESSRSRHICPITLPSSHSLCSG